MAPTDDCEGAGLTTPTEPVPILARVDEQRAARGRRLARSTAIFALATGISRVLGLVREIVAAYYFGAAGKINAFTVAFQVPNLFRSLVADAALSSAFVPVFSELLEKGDRKRAWRVASTPLLADAARPRRPHRAPDHLRAARDRALRRSRRRQGAGDRPLPDPVPDHRAARGLRRDRRDPQQLRPLHRPGAVAGLLEPRDHRRASSSAFRGPTRSTPSSTSTPSRS